MFDTAMAVLLVFVAASIGETVHFDNEFIENMVHGLGVFTALFMSVIGAAAIIGLIRRGSKSEENKKG